MKLCLHQYEKIELEPSSTYFDYTGFKVGVFKCRCSKCGKIKYKKFIKEY